jgi:hypothetical protein
VKRGIALGLSQAKRDKTKIQQLKRKKINNKQTNKTKYKKKWLLDLPVQSVPITTNVVSSKPAHVEVYSIQHYVIKFVSDLQQVVGFHWVLQ